MLPTLRAVLFTRESQYLTGLIVCWLARALRFETDASKAEQEQAVTSLPSRVVGNGCKSRHGPGVPSGEENAEVEGERRAECWAPEAPKLASPNPPPQITKYLALKRAKSNSVAYRSATVLLDGISAQEFLWKNIPFSQSIAQNQPYLDPGQSLYRVAFCGIFITPKPTKLGILNSTEWVHELCYLKICVSTNPTAFLKYLNLKLFHRSDFCTVNSALLVAFVVLRH